MRKVIKWIIICGLSALITAAFGICAKAAGASEDAPAPTPDMWDGGELELPDWDFEFATLVPAPSPTPDPRLRVISDDINFSPMPTDWAVSYPILWSQFLYNGDSSVWYFHSHTNNQIAVSSSSGDVRPFQPWLDSSYEDPNPLRGQFYFSSGSSSFRPPNDSYVMVDMSRGDFNFSFFDFINPADEDGYNSLIDTNMVLYYTFSFNRIFPKFSNLPSWASEAGISETMLYDLMVYPSFQIFTNSQGLTYFGNRDPVKLSDLYSGVPFIFDLSTLFNGEVDTISEIHFNFYIPLMSGDNPIITKYRDYLSAHPEITGHVPLNFYWDFRSVTSYKSAYTLNRYYGVSPKQDDRNWLQKLFIPSQEEITDLFMNYVPSIDSEGTTGFYLGIRQLFYEFLGNAPSNDVTLTLPAFSIPINGSDYKVWDSYRFNMNDTLRSIAILPTLQVATSFLLVTLFINSVFSMIVTVFDIHWFDGVK